MHLRLWICFLAFVKPCSSLFHVHREDHKVNFSSFIKYRHDFILKKLRVQLNAFFHIFSVYVYNNSKSCLVIIDYYVNELFDCLLHVNAVFIIAHFAMVNAENNSLCIRKMMIPQIRQIAIQLPTLKIDFLICSKLEIIHCITVHRVMLWL